MLDLRHLTSILRWMFIIAMDSDGTLKFRLAGSSLEEAMGCGMTDRNYGDIFSVNGEGTLSEQLYALSIVQGCGVFRTGTFSLDGMLHHDLEVMALPFIDQRALGGTVLVGVLKPFDFENSSYVDRRPTYETSIDDVLIIPSPRVISKAQLPESVEILLAERGIELRALDLQSVMEMSDSGQLLVERRMPSFDLETAVANLGEVLN